jgi:hypothetical protein
MRNGECVDTTVQAPVSQTNGYNKGNYNNNGLQRSQTSSATYYNQSKLNRMI